jgi:REP element-mobilizing transposase RayT
MDRYRITEGIGVYFVTFTIVDWLPIFIDETAAEIVTGSLNHCVQQKNLRVIAYVIMPTHFHAVVFDKDFDPKRLEKTLTEFRKFTGKQLSNHVDNNFSENIAAILRAQPRTDRERQFWQQGWHAEGIFSQAFLQQKVDYIHMNPCRKGLVREPQHWRFSSAAYWLDGKSVDVEISDVIWG